MQLKAAFVVVGFVLIKDVTAVAIAIPDLVAHDGEFKSKPTHSSTGYVFHPHTRTTLKVTTSPQATSIYSVIIFPKPTSALPHTILSPRIPTFVADTVEQKREIEARAEEDTDASTCCDFYLVDRSLDTETDAADTKVGYSWKRDVDTSSIAEWTDGGPVPRDLEARAEEESDASTCCDFYLDLVDRDIKALPEEASPE